MCVLGLPFLAGVLWWVCFCAFPACTPPILAGVRCACVWVRVLTFTPRILAGVLGHVCLCARSTCIPPDWLGCAVWMCVFWCRSRLRPAIPGWGVGVGVFLWSLSASTPPVLARCAVWVCVRGFGLRLRPVISGRPVGVCVFVCALLLSRNSWLGRAVWVCVLGFGFQLHPAIPSLVVGVGVFLWSLSASTLPVLSGVCGVGVCAWVRVSAAARKSWLGCWGVCVCLWARSACMPPFLAGVVGLWVGCCLAPAPLPWLVACCASRVRGPRWTLLLGTCPCALVGAGGVPLWRASWPRVVHRASSGPVAVGAPVGFPEPMVPFPTLEACAPGFTGRLRGAGGGRPSTGLFVPAAGPCRGRGAGLALGRTRSGPRDGVVPRGFLRRRSWAVCAAVVRPVWTRSLTRPVSRTVRLSTGASVGAPALFRVDADISPFGSEDATPVSRACVR